MGSAMNLKTGGHLGVDKNGWIDLREVTGRPLCRLPRELRERDEALGHCSSLVAA